MKYGESTERFGQRYRQNLPKPCAEGTNEAHEDNLQKKRTNEPTLSKKRTNEPSLSLSLTQVMHVEI